MFDIHFLNGGRFLQKLNLKVPIIKQKSDIEILSQISSYYD